MAHEKRLVICEGPHAPHAFDGIPILPRTGQLDVPCSNCAQHGQWNGQIDLASFRSIRVICDHCDGRGWLETGSDPVTVHDVIYEAGTAPKWVQKIR